MNLTKLSRALSVFFFFANVKNGLFKMVFLKDIYVQMSKRPFGDCVSNENNTYVRPTTTTLSRRLYILIAIPPQIKNLKHSSWKHYYNSTWNQWYTAINSRSPTCKNKKKSLLLIELILEVTTKFRKAFSLLFLHDLLNERKKRESF